MEIKPQRLRPVRPDRRQVVQADAPRERRHPAGACPGLRLDQNAMRGPVIQSRQKIHILIWNRGRELGISTLALSKLLGISQPTASQSVKRGEKIVKEKQLKVMG